MINSFIDRINVARAGNENVIQANVLQLEMRKELNKTAERTMAVLEPAKLTLTNLEKD
jgi:glutaminyl-tRNA synthetase